MSVFTRTSSTTALTEVEKADKALLDVLLLGARGFRVTEPPQAPIQEGEADTVRRAKIASRLPSIQELNLIVGDPPKEWLAEQSWQ